jgi:hypothetical protein
MTGNVLIGEILMVLGMIGFLLFGGYFIIGKPIEHNNQKFVDQCVQSGTAEFVCWKIVGVTK